MSTGIPSARICSAVLTNDPTARLISASRSSGSWIAQQCPSHVITPAKRKLSHAAICSASLRASPPGCTPARCMPVSTSITARGRVPNRCAASSSSRTFSMASTDTQISACVARAATRRALIGPTIWLGTRMSRMPFAAMTSASPSLAQATPMAPASTCRCAIAGHLCDFECGRHPAPRDLTSAAMVAILDSSASRSINTAGVSSSSIGRPIRVVSMVLARSLKQSLSSVASGYPSLSVVRSNHAPAIIRPVRAQTEQAFLVGGNNL